MAPISDIIRSTRCDPLDHNQVLEFMLSEDQQARRAHKVGDTDAYEAHMEELNRLQSIWEKMR